MEKELERMRLLAIKNFFVEAGITYEDVITEYQVDDLHDVGGEHPAFSRDSILEGKLGSSLIENECGEGYLDFTNKELIKHFKYPTKSCENKQRFMMKID